MRRPSRRSTLCLQRRDLPRRSMTTRLRAPTTPMRRPTIPILTHLLTLTPTHITGTTGTPTIGVRASASSLAQVTMAITMATAAITVAATTEAITRDDTFPYLSLLRHSSSREGASSAQIEPFRVGSQVVNEKCSDDGNPYQSTLPMPISGSGEVRGSDLR